MIKGWRGGTQGERRQGEGEQPKLCPPPHCRPHDIGSSLHTRLTISRCSLSSWSACACACMAAVVVVFDMIMMASVCALPLLSLLPSHVTHALCLSHSQRIHYECRHRRCCSSCAVVGSTVLSGFKTHASQLR